MLPRSVVSHGRLYCLPMNRTSDLNELITWYTGSYAQAWQDDMLSSYGACMIKIMEV